MSDLIVFEDENGMQQYKRLILQRDRLKKEETAIWLEYLRKFGELIEQSLNLQIECIKCKKIIAYCQARVNRGEKINAAELDGYIAVEMAGYYEELENISNARKAETTVISDYKLMQIKRIYREIAIAVHPDLHPDTVFTQEVSDLWERAKLAYKANDLNALLEVKVLLGGYIKNVILEDDEIDAEKLNILIENVRKQIEEIVTGNTYQYKDLLADESLCEEKSEHLKEQISEYELYLAQLREKLNEYDITEELN